MGFTLIYMDSEKASSSKIMQANTGLRGNEEEDNDCLSPQQAYAPFVPPVTIELTARCNFKCPYCANPTLQRTKGEMPTEMILRLAEECQSNGYSVMAVHGIGEPLLRKDLEVILAKFNEMGIWSGWISTNGSLLSLERMKTLVAAGLQGLYCSMDTLDADIYTRTRGGKLSKTIGNIQAAAAAHPNVNIVVGLMNHREQTLGKSDLDIFYHLFKGHTNVHHHEYENMRFPQAAEDWRRIDEKTNRRVEFKTCDQWGHHFTIAIDGRVSVCCVDQEVDHEIGNVMTSSIREIWLGRRSQETFRSILLGLHDSPKVCFNCILKPSEISLGDVEPIFAKPYFEVLQVADQALARGDTATSLRLFKHLLRRSPQKTDIAEKVKRLSGSQPTDLFATAKNERDKRNDSLIDLSGA